MAIKYAPIPIVAAPFGRVLGGGLEVCLHCDRVQADADVSHGPGGDRRGPDPRGRRHEGVAAPHHGARPGCHLAVPQHDAARSTR